MSEFDFHSGEFVSFRAVKKFHLGSIEKDLEVGAVLQFDGTIAKIGTQEHTLPVIRAAIKTGWLVPINAPVGDTAPKPAGVTVRPAQSTGAERGATQAIPTVHDEERDLGNLQTVRDRGDGVVRRSVATHESSEGEVVGKLRTSAQQKTRLTTENVTQVTQAIRAADNVQGTSRVSDRVVPVKVGSATGDVQEARAGDAIDELLGDAVVARLPPVTNPNLGEGRDPHLTESEREEKAARAQEAAQAARKARLVQAGASTPAEAPAEAPPSEDSPLPLDLAQRVMAIKSVIPSFEWDLTRHWQTRVTDAVKRFGKNPMYLNGILSVETEAVKAGIAKALSK